MRDSQLMTSTSISTRTRNDFIDLYATYDYDEEEEEEEDIDVIGWTKVKPSSTHYKHYHHKYENSIKKINSNKTQKYSCKDIAPCFAQSYVILYICLTLRIFVSAAIVC